MANDRQELEDLRRLDELERKAKGTTAPAKAKEAAPEKPARKPDLTDVFGEGPVGLAEAGRSMAGGFAAPIAGNIAGLGAIPLHAMGAIKTEPEEVQRRVTGALTPPPPTTGVGKGLMLPGEMLGKAVNWGAGKVESGLMPPPTDAGPLSEVRRGVARGAGEAVRQAPGLVGAKAPGVAAAAGEGMKDLARTTMQSALKPPLKAQQTGKAARAVDTLLDEGINVSKGGVETLNDRIGVLNDKIAQRIANSPATISKQAVGYRLQGALDKFEKQVTPLTDVKAIQRAWDEFLDHPLLQDRIPVKTAQEMKQGTYKALGDKAYGELKGADIEAQKTLARGLKEEIAAAVPEVRQLNAQESSLLNALSLVERRVLMEANKNPFGLGWLTSNPVKFAGWMADRSGLFKSLIARMINTSSQAMPGMGAAGVPMGMGISGQAHPGIPPPPQ
jgi:hypothetical protein